MRISSINNDMGMIGSEASQETEVSRFRSEKGVWPMALKNDDLLSIYRYMVMGRTIEDALAKASGKFHSAAYEEGVVVGTFYNLSKEDVVAPHFRGVLVVFYMRGASLRKLLAGNMGKATGYCQGRNVSRCAPIELNALGWLHTNVGPQIYLGTGAGLAAKVMKREQVAVVSFGDGTSNRGEFHESINLAAILKLPVVFVCQNNQYAISMPACKGLGCRSIADRAAGYGIPGVEVDGNDVLAVHEAVQFAVQRARAGEGPSLIDARTFRVSGHWAADTEFYRSKTEIDEWKKKDPITHLEKKLMMMGILSEGDRDQIRKAAEREVSEAMKQAETDPLPGEELFGLNEVFCPVSPEGEAK